VLTDGYAAHLSSLTSADNPIQPLGNLRLSLRKAGFSFQGHQAANVSQSRTNRVRKTASLPSQGHQLSVADEGSPVVGNERGIDV